MYSQEYKCSHVIITLSSNLKGTLNATPPTPSPSPSPEPTISLYPASPVHSPAPSPDTVIISHQHHPRYLHILVRVHTASPSTSPSSQLSPHVLPAPVVSNAPSPGNKGSAQDLILHHLPHPCHIILDVPTAGGRLMLVDMAGSENIEQAGQIGFEAKMQTAKINQGNIALKRVVESIANGDSHVPFRDSKLTMLLQDSFEDDKTKILMVLCASPDPEEIHKTISTLEYGAKAKCIDRGLLRWMNSSLNCEGKISSKRKSEMKHTGVTEERRGCCTES
ncbi:unnamed protein product [Prunus armeniaca]|uniref:Kinesin motor domain-containing protein n=1 Tax=Prunus armeniaca TaxID=36596 RepID=A0A6J5VAF3_PRUAR|nr:unnamed protein product [Prunus armeniaca]